MAGFYSFIRGIPGKLGVGVADRGLLQPQSLPNYSGIGFNRQVQRCLGPTSRAYMVLGQDVPTVSPLGFTGLTLHGVPILTHLAEKEGPK